MQLKKKDIIYRAIKIRVMANVSSEIQWNNVFKCV